MSTPVSSPVVRGRNGLADQSRRAAEAIDAQMLADHPGMQVRR